MILIRTLVLVCLLTASLAHSQIFVPRPRFQIMSQSGSPAIYMITLYTKFGGGLSFNHTGYPNASTADYPAGNYSAEARVYLCPYCPGFDHWNSTGGIKVLQPQQSPSNVTISDSGTLTAYYHYFPGISIQPSTILMGALTTLIAYIMLMRRTTTSRKRSLTDANSRRVSEFM